MFVYGGLYSGRMRYDRGRFPEKKVMLSVTTGAPAPTFTRHGRSGHIVALLWPIHYSLYYLGVSVLPPQVTCGVQGGAIATSRCRGTTSPPPARRERRRERSMAAVH